MNLKIKSNSNVRIKEIIEDEICSTTWVDPETVFEPHIEPKNIPLGHKKSLKINPKSIQNKMSELKERKK